MPITTKTLKEIVEKNENYFGELFIALTQLDDQLRGITSEITGSNETEDKTLTRSKGEAKANYNEWASYASLAINLLHAYQMIAIEKHPKQIENIKKQVKDLAIKLIDDFQSTSDPNALYNCFAEEIIVPATARAMKEPASKKNIESIEKNLNIIGVDEEYASSIANALTPKDLKAAQSLLKHVKDLTTFEMIGESNPLTVSTTITYNGKQYTLKEEPISQTSEDINEIYQAVKCYYLLNPEERENPKAFLENYQLKYKKIDESLKKTIEDLINTIESDPNLKPYLIQAVNQIADSLANGIMPTIPTQLRYLPLPGLRNAYRFTVSEGDNTLFKGFKAANPVQLLKDKALSRDITAQNHQQLQAVTGAEHTFIHTLVSPVAALFSFNAATEADRKAFSHNQKATKQLAEQNDSEENSENQNKTHFHFSNTAFNQLRALNAGYELGGVNQLLALARSHTDTNIQKLVKDIEKLTESSLWPVAEFFQGRNRNLEIAVLSWSLAHRLNVITGNEKHTAMLTGCMSGKDREGVLCWFEAALAIYHDAHESVNKKKSSLGEIFNDSEKNKNFRKVLEAVAESGHIPRMAALAGGSIGAYGQRSESQTAVPKQFQDLYKQYCHRKPCHYNKEPMNSLHPDRKMPYQVRKYMGRTLLFSGLLGSSILSSSMLGNLLGFTAFAALNVASFGTPLLIAATAAITVSIGLLLYNQSDNKKYLAHIAKAKSETDYSNYHKMLKEKTNQCSTYKILKVAGTPSTAPHSDHTTTITLGNQSGKQNNITEKDLTTLVTQNNYDIKFTKLPSSANNGTWKLAHQSNAEETMDFNVVHNSVSLTNIPQKICNKDNVFLKHCIALAIQTELTALGDNREGAVIDISIQNAGDSEGNLKALLTQVISEGNFGLELNQFNINNHPLAQERESNNKQQDLEKHNIIIAP